MHVCLERMNRRIMYHGARLLRHEAQDGITGHPVEVPVIATEHEGDQQIDVIAKYCPFCGAQLRGEAADREEAATR